ncbi:MAG: C40 family peptidase [Bacteroidales bacterium]|jgi:cell wall-associated NlpC family hydrolase|nr:C40 family peptidase [Bacteroidales bacterium]
MSDFGIGKTSLIPVRKTSSERDEMITQILFGEVFEILTIKNTWSYIKILHDNYEGWIDNSMYTKISKNAADDIINSDSVVTDKLFTIAKNINSQNNIILPVGSTLPSINRTNNSFRLLNQEYKVNIKPNSFNNTDYILNTALQFINAPYLWGGKSPFGIDCSGLSQIIYKILNFKIPRDARDQVKLGKEISFFEKVKTGDLAFFDNEEGEITHVGLILSDKKIIHSSGYVRIDKIDHQGIFNTDTNKYTHKLRVIKRLLS